MDINWMLGLQGLVLGLGAVFLVLIILIVLIFIMGKVAHGKPKKDKVDEKSMQPVIKTLSNPKNDEEEIIAVITATIACMASREGKKYKIKSFKRV